MIRKIGVALTILALAVGVSTVCAQTNWFRDDFSGALTWTTYGYPGILNVVNQQLVVSANHFGPMETNNPNATHVPAVHAFPDSGALPDHQTLEMRADLVGANENDDWAGIAFNWMAPGLGSGYMFMKDEDEVSLMKFYNGATSYAFFFYTNQPTKNQNVTLVLALTRDGSNLKINTRVLDKDNANAVLFDRTVTDTPEKDPVLPSRAVRGTIGMADPAGTPWPVLLAPALIQVTLTWVNAQRAPELPTQVIFDNVEVWQYESPQLAIQRAIVLSWPVTEGQFIVETAPGVNGPWAPVAAPWGRTNATQNEVCIEAPDSMKLFRLRFAP